ncbi:cell wall hydrolase [Arenimonas terrae]|jgi:spore germination cell wall hydrolase CwlJ-like protein|uniref:Cell wall hydrolase n=1 Tax=Arenimonas terrae TaxID=2546226 RepID=A0A5C4RR58_9GAMM|nr:cell wall hydrolase [Arenimonas terrae]TNJ33455.1 cell wall hydrolase [Arenimonas terrae]
MKLSFILWLAQILPQPAADPLCLATTVYLEARDQSELGQRAVAEVALRRRDSGQWGESVCEVVTARKQFAPTIVHPGLRMKNLQAWERAVQVAFQAQQDWQLPAGERREVVPGASHFAALDLANPAWATAPRVATIGDHTFFRVQRLTPPAAPASVASHHLAP